MRPPHQPEFSRPERLDAIGERARNVRIAADEGERAALARRFGLLGVEQLEAELSVQREAGAVVVVGRVRGQVMQACSVTGEPLDASVDEPVALRFVEDAVVGEEELELSGDAIDTLPIENGAVDLGEAAAETLVLALDPFPRASDADAALKEAGVLGEGDAGPFGALAALKGRLKG